jgi:hypothetical protein
MSDELEKPTDIEICSTLIERVHALPWHCMHKVSFRLKAKSVLNEQLILLYKYYDNVVKNL